MPVVIRKNNIIEPIAPTAFPLEAGLQELLADNPELLRQESDSPFAFVASEVDLGEAGFLDLLLVSRDGLPIAVEVKLQRNAQARREVVAQAIDYISALTDKTVDELDEMLDGKVEKALRGFDESEDEEAFERRWRTLGANLRAGLARLLVAVDGSNPGLERILRFLAEKSELDVQLVVVERFLGSDGHEVLVARPTFSHESVSRASTPSERKPPSPELLAAIEIYNKTAVSDFLAVGVATNYRQIRPKAWPNVARTHYEFYVTKTTFGAELHLEADIARPLSRILEPLAGTAVLGGKKKIVWDPVWSNGRGRLTVQFSPSEEPSNIADAMRELIDLTYKPVTDALGQLISSR